MLQERLGRWDSQRVAFLECQAVEDELAEGERLLRELADRAAADRREPVGADELVVGLKCGGSDGLSGITANPLAGRVTDRVIAMGGSALLAEVPGCVQKGGNTPIVDVLHYGETVRRRGLTVLQTPGNDLVSATGLAAAGAHLILFTTGRGTPFGAPVPTLKLATNTALASRKAGWIDYDAGGLAQGDAWEPHIQALLQLVLDTASGAPTRAEAAGYREIAIWKDGVTL